jgi:thiosulfate/3-mercaptopyruvate sulfurtransferase
MKNKISRFICMVLTGCMVICLMSSCGKQGVSDDELVSTKPFTGKYLITADEAKDMLGDDNVMFVDCRGSSQAKKGTVQGAVATTWQEISTCEEQYGEAGDENWGKIPESEELSNKLSALGLSKDKMIILIGETLDGWGEDARVLWELAAAGYENLKIVDGGYDALKDAGISIQKGASKPVKAKVSIEKLNQTHVMETEELQKNYDEYKIIDVRTDAEYNGATKYKEAKGGHLPGAIHIRYTDLFREDGTLRSIDDIEQMMSDAGISKEDKIVAYCTGGIRSAYMQIVLEMAGYQYTWNYDQSYWRWAVVGEVES